MATLLSENTLLPSSGRHSSNDPFCIWNSTLPHLKILFVFLMLTDQKRGVKPEYTHAYLCSLSFLKKAKNILCLCKPCLCFGFLTFPFTEDRIDGDDVHSDCHYVITCHGVHCVCLGNEGATLNLFLMIPKLLPFLKNPELLLSTYFISDTSTWTKRSLF